MTLASPTKPLGAVLQQAGLISAAQVNLALQEQAIHQRRFGDLLCEHGWIQAPTTHFFAEAWPILYHDPDLMPLGQYFRQAHLLTDAQIGYLLKQQDQTQLRFGVLAVANGWVKLQTINFFLTHLHLQDNPQLQQVETDQAINFDTPEYWQHLRDYLLENEQANPYALLHLYEQILTYYEIPFTGTLEQTTLLNLGLVTLHDQVLVIAHPLFRSVLNPEWIQRERQTLHPYDTIRLQFLNLSKAGAYPYRILEAILDWTNNQPLLSQKVAHLVRMGAFIPAGEEAVIIEQLVQKHMIQNWRTGFVRKHLKRLETQILQNSNCDPIDLLTYYQVIWYQLQAQATNGDEEAELLRLGLLTQDGLQVKIANQIYRWVFDQTWLEQQISSILDPLHTEEETSAGWTPNIDDLYADEDAESELLARYSLGQLLGALLLGGLGLGAMIWVLSSPPQPQTEQILDAEGSVSTEQRLRSTPSATFQANRPAQPSTIPSPSGKAVLMPHRLPIFSIGVTEAEIQAALGPPTVKSPGYWPNSYGVLYKNIQPYQTDFGFLLDVKTQRIRQTEAAFAQSAGLTPLHQTLQGMLKSRPPATVTQQLALIYYRQAQEYQFRVGKLKGMIQRNEKDRIYIGVWDAEFH
ncbi:hypothetical protein [Acaryochloris sp. IP29b_bin.148]|uniref:hypothetical protein n=1 Tax=Acaryochloris sp. IP29b_bin.148 TaxID=2969218 RepID=UPI00260BCAE7|nr:hypothetical protein [Acaryochloris sp. IP29b_bin.148]